MGFFSGIVNLFKPSSLGGSSSNGRANNGASSGSGSAREVISLNEYWQGRDQAYPEDWTYEVRENAKELLRRINALLAELNVVSVKVVSGWRPPQINKSVGGATKSYHMTGQAVDLRDNDGQEFAKLLARNSQLLRKYRLWLENPNNTRGNTNWVHLDMGIRTDKDPRVFNA